MLWFLTKCIMTLKLAHYEVQSRTCHCRGLRLRRLRGRQAPLPALPLASDRQELVGDEYADVFERRGMQAEPSLGTGLRAWRHLGGRHADCGAETQGLGATHSLNGLEPLASRTLRCAIWTSTTAGNSDATGAPTQNVRLLLRWSDVWALLHAVRNASFLPASSSPLSMETPSLPAFAWSQENNRSNRATR